MSLRISLVIGVSYGLFLTFLFAVLFGWTDHLVGRTLINVLVAVTYFYVVHGALVSAHAEGQ